MKQLSLAPAVPLATATGTVPMILRAHPVSADAGIVQARAGQTLEQMLREAAGGRELAELEVRCGGYAVPRDHWDRVRPKEGAVIEVTGIPQGGMNANWRGVLMIIVTIIIFAYTGYLSGEGWGLTATQWGTVAMMTTSAVVPSLIQPPGIHA